MITCRLERDVEQSREKDPRNTMPSAGMSLIGLID
jgi:hypothetical protein